MQRRYASMEEIECADDRVEIEERAGILEFQFHYSRPEAEREALRRWNEKVTNNSRD